MHKTNKQKAKEVGAYSIPHKSSQKKQKLFSIKKVKQKEYMC